MKKTKNAKVLNTGFIELDEDEVKERVGQAPWMEERTFKLASNIEEVREYIDNAIKAERCALDLETTGLSTRVETVEGKKVPVNKIIGFCLSYDPKFGLYIPIRHKEGSQYNLPEDSVLEEIRRLMFNCVTIYHNAKFDLTFLKNYGIELDHADQFEDTLLLAHLHDSGRKGNGLKVISGLLINQPMLKLKDIAKEGHLDLACPTIVRYYGAGDAICTLDLYNFFMGQKIIQDQRSIYNLEKQVVFVVMSMEENLMKINVPYLKELKEKAKIRLKDIEQEIYDLVGYKFNIGSTQKLGKVLFEDLKFKYPEKGLTKSGQYSTDSKTLAKIADLYPVVNKIVEYRGMEKVLSTYIENLLKNHDEEDCVKLNFKQTGTDTGRFSAPGGDGLKMDGCSGVNVQSMPKMPDEKDPDFDLRSSFVAREGNTLVAADYATEEYRIATNISREATWIKFFKDGIDFHTATGAIISGKNPKDVTKAERKIGKTVNFLALYLGGPYTLAGNAKITVAEAKKVLATFFAGVPKLKKWIDKEIVLARKIKFVKTIFGRTRPLAKYYESGDKGLMNHADRCAVNTKIQGSAADIMKLIMYRIYAWLTRNNLHDEIKILITMHDELVFEMPTEKIKLYVPEICKIMELKDIIIDKLKWQVPLEVDVKYGDSWRVKNDFFKDFPELRQKLKEPLMELTPSQRVISEENDDKKKESPVEEVESKEVESEESLKEESKIESVVEDSRTDTQDIVEEVQDGVPEVEKKEEDLKKDKEKSEVKSNENWVVSDSYFIYTLKDLNKTVLRWMNNILTHLIDRAKTEEDGVKKIIKIRDKEGNSLLVSEYKLNVEHFIALTSFFDI